jgi:hypothetical protein
MKNLPDINLPCGGRAYFDLESEISYRCYNCMATVGSMGQPKHCREEYEKWEAWKKLGGKEWNFFDD